jgi:transcriptional antiterminator NusG
MKNWYVVHTQASLENKVKEGIESAVRAEGLGERIVQVLIPTEEVVEIRDGKRTVSTQKMFPNYVIVEMDYDDETWAFIKEIPGVTGFVGPGRKPIPLSDAEVENILSQINSTDEKPRPKIMFEASETVKVIDGPFFNFTGYVAEINEERGRLKVMVDILGRSTPVELDFLQVEKITEED